MLRTCHPLPVGIKLLILSNIEKYSTYVFENIDPDFHIKAQMNKEKDRTNIIVAGESYGQGSSREHAALCPAFLGVKIVIAKSIERIHMQNLINFGIVPLIFQNPEDYDKISQEDDIEISNIIDGLNDGKVILRIKCKDIRITLNSSLTEDEINILESGGKLNYYGTQDNTN